MISFKFIYDKQNDVFIAYDYARNTKAGEFTKDTLTYEILSCIEPIETVRNVEIDSKNDTIVAYVYTFGSIVLKDGCEWKRVSIKPAFGFIMYTFKKEKKEEEPSESKSTQETPKEETKTKRRRGRPPKKSK